MKNKKEAVEKDGLCDASVSLCLFIHVCVHWSKAAIWSTACLGVSQLGSVALWQPASVLQDPTLPCLTPCLQKIHSVKYWWSFALGLTHHSTGLQQGPRCDVQIREGYLWPCPAACSPVGLVMSPWDTYTWLLVSAVAMRTITRYSIYGNPWGRQEGGREWERFSATLQLVSCSKTMRHACKETSGCCVDLVYINY